jgi:hypothetical protein
MKRSSPELYFLWLEFCSSQSDQNPNHKESSFIQCLFEIWQIRRQTLESYVPKEGSFVPNNHELFEQMEAEFPDFRWEIGGSGVVFTNWPTEGACLSPLRVGDSISLEKIRVHLNLLGGNKKSTLSPDDLSLQQEALRLAQEKRKKERRERKRKSRGRNRHFGGGISCL